jgi:hypothetical protein
MLARPIASRATFACGILSTTAFCIFAGAATGETPPVAGWHSQSHVARNQGNTTANTSKWRLPNGAQESAAGMTAAESHAVNPLRQKAAPPQRRQQQTPEFAVQSAASTQISRKQNAPTRTGQYFDEQVTQTSGMIANKPAATANRPVAYQPPTAPRTAHRPPTSGNRGSHSQVWQRINVAMQGPDPATTEQSDEEESLPMPSQMMSSPEADPFGPSDMYIGDGGPYYPSCGPEGCPGNCECGGACTCGAACEPGCGCSSGDGCYNCEGECVNDCLNIGPGDPESCHSVRIRVPKWQELQVFAGVQGFKGPYDQNRDRGNFGFHEGFNVGLKIPYTFAGYQVGYQAAQSQLNGDENQNIPESHTQHFATIGLFRRATDGLQFGTAWDVLRDQRFDAVDFHQLRSEVSWMDCGRHEFGFSGTVGMNEIEYDDDTWAASDQYVLFYRIHGPRGGEGRLYGGWNDNSDGILGSDMILPVHDRWSIQTGFTYLIPDAQSGDDGASEEAWNINLSLVWHWDCRARKSHADPYRPLFNVANNGYLIVDQVED